MVDVSLQSSGVMDRSTVMMKAMKKIVRNSQAAR